MILCMTTPVWLTSWSIRPSATPMKQKRKQCREQLKTFHIIQERHYGIWSLLHIQVSVKVYRITQDKQHNSMDILTFGNKLSNCAVFGKTCICILGILSFHFMHGFVKGFSFVFYNMLMTTCFLLQCSQEACRCVTSIPTGKRHVHNTWDVTVILNLVQVCNFINDVLWW